jgi:serine phosphatase RsbU (regulator of sigma subunit)
MQVGERVLGALSVAWADRRDLAPDEIELLSALSAQCAQALDRLQAREAEREAEATSRAMSETLQRGLLTEPPDVPELEIVVRYRPAGAQTQIGGDWYDAFRMRDGSTAVVIGDVTGHDRFAAAAMAQLRNLVRGLSNGGPSPAEILGNLDEAMDRLHVDALATSILVLLTRRRPGEHELTWSNAGHPPPLLLAPDGTATFLDTPPDLLLGWSATTERVDHTASAPAGTTVLLYTDGLVERRGHHLGESLEALCSAASRCTGLPLDDLCDEVLDHLADAPEDDVALVAVRIRPPEPAGP